MKTFEEASQEFLQSGSLKFSTRYVSRKQLYEAAVQWAESDDNVLAAGLRGGGGDQIAIDFRYDMSHLDEQKKARASALLNDVFKPFFSKVLGGDYMVGWDYSSPTEIVK